MTLEIPYEVTTPVNDVEVKIDIYRIDGLLVYRTSSVLSGLGLVELNKSDKLSIKFESVPFVTSEYYVNISFVKDEDKEIEVYKEACRFIVESSKGEGGVASMKNTWN